MMMKSAVGILAVALLFSLSGCGFDSRPAAETRHETKTIELEKAETARVAIRMGAGELHVQSGTSKLLEADFSYNVPEWEPVVDYRVTNSVGDLTISQPNSSGIFSRTVNKWDLKLNGQLPLDVTTTLGAGDANLEFGQMNLNSVDVSMGAGELKLDLRGEPKRDYKVHVNGGVGEATVHLPKDVAISARATGGIGEISASGLEKRDGVWVNADRPQGPVTIQLDIKGGVGEIHLVR